ncbi:hypothetical protein Tco_0573069, partial [Tanacetum coccineum]
MIKMLQNIDREDLETIWKLVKSKHGNTRPKDEYERVLWGDMKMMNIKFRGGLLGLKDFKMILRVTAAQAQRIQPTLYDGSVIAKEHAVISVTDDEETLILEEESRSKMLDKQNDLISIKKKIKISPIDYSKTVIIPYLNTLLCHIHAVEIELLEVNFLSLKDTFNVFDKTLLDEITEVETVFNPIEVVVDQCSSCVDECNKCLELENELLKKKDLIEKDVYDKLFKSYSTLENHCISLELATQLNQEIFQKDNFGEIQNDPTFNQLFEINKLKAQSQEKDTVIRKLKDRIKSLSGKASVEKVKKDIDGTETINIELEH